MNTNTLSRKAKIVKSIVNDTNGKFFQVVFTKKDGSERVLNGRTGVRKHLKGGQSTISANPSLVSVYDVQAQGYRCFDADRVISLKVDGVDVSLGEGE
jgi:hypothetical protein